MLEYIICIDFILLCYALFKRVLGTRMSFLIFEIYDVMLARFLINVELLFNYRKKKKKHFRALNPNPNAI